MSVPSRFLAEMKGEPPTLTEPGLDIEFEDELEMEI
jgi:hypothetical protein